MRPEQEIPMESNEGDTSPPREESEQDSPEVRSVREKTFARRALLRAGWTVPVVLSVGLPRNALAGSVHGDTGVIGIHGDSTGSGHGDATFLHGDATKGGAHGDGSSGSLPGIFGDSGFFHKDAVDP